MSIRMSAESAQPAAIWYTTVDVMLVCVCVCVQALRKIGQDFLILMLCVTIFLSYLPEAGEYSSFFVYLRLVTCHLQHTDTQLAGL